jgi:hypothetical protein
LVEEEEEEEIVERSASEDEDDGAGPAPRSPSPASSSASDGAGPAPRAPLADAQTALSVLEPPLDCMTVALESMSKFMSLHEEYIGPEYESASRLYWHQGTDMATVAERTDKVIKVYRNMGFACPAAVAECLVAAGYKSRVYSFPPSGQCINSECNGCGAAVASNVLVLLAPTGSGKTLMALVAAVLAATSMKMPEIVVRASKSTHAQWIDAALKLAAAAKGVLLPYKFEVNGDENYNTLRKVPDNEQRRISVTVLAAGTNTTPRALSNFRVRPILIVDEFYSENFGTFSSSRAFPRVIGVCAHPTAQMLSAAQARRKSRMHKHLPHVDFPWTLVFTSEAQRALAAQVKTEMDALFVTTIHVAVRRGQPILTQQNQVDVALGTVQAVALLSDKLRTFDIDVKSVMTPDLNAVSITELVAQLDLRLANPKDAWKFSSVRGEMMGIRIRLKDTESECAVCFEHISLKDRVLTACCMNVNICATCFSAPQLRLCPLCRRQRSAIKGAVVFKRAQQTANQQNALIRRKGAPSIEEAVHVALLPVTTNGRIYNLMDALVAVLEALKMLIEWHKSICVLMVVEKEGYVNAIKREAGKDTAVFHLFNKGTVKNPATVAKATKTIKDFKNGDEGLRVMYITRSALLDSSKNNAVDGLDISNLDGVVSLVTGDEHGDHKKQIAGRLSRRGRVGSALGRPFFISVDFVAEQ